MAAVFNQCLGTDFKASYLPKFVRKILSLFIPVLKEVEEMLYQFEQVYNFSSAKFEARFPDFKVTPYEEGVQAMIDSLRE